MSCAATEQANLNLFSVSSAFGINSSSFFSLFLDDVGIAVLFVYCLSGARARGAQFEWGLESSIPCGLFHNLRRDVEGVDTVAVRVVRQAVLEGYCPVAFIVSGQMRYYAFAGR
jgi:hypothetical protein